MRQHILTLLLVCSVLAGCYSGAASGPAGGSRSSLTGPIGIEELDRSAAPNAYEALRTLRPAWLHARGQTSVRREPDRPVVYVNNIRLGTPESLRDISAADVRVIQYLDSRQSQLRFGSGHEGGVILVTLRS